MARKPKQKAQQAAPDPEITEEIDPAEELEEFAPGLVVSLPRKRHPGGRPPKYRKEYATMAGIMLRRGATINELAEAFGVTNACIHYWKTKHQEFFDQFFEVSDAIVARAELSLAERAVGYTYDSVKVFNYKGIPLVVPVKEHVPPDIGAIKHLLAVKKPDIWRIKEEVAVTGDEAFREIFMKMADKKDEAK